MTQRTTIRLPEDLLLHAKRKAVAEHRTLTSLIEEGLRLLVSEQLKATRTRRSLPRISKATGGTTRGIDLADSAILQDLDDVDYFRGLNKLK